MRVAILGYGKMGKAIEPILIERGHEVVLKINSQNPLKLSDLEGVDVAIEISRPDLALTHIEACLKSKTPIVVGTTGWYEHLSAIKDRVETEGLSLLYATNFSIGVHIVFALNKILAKWMDQYPEYHPSIEEIHHTAKLDAPSGTGITLAEGILHHLERKDNWVNRISETENELALTSIREENVPGTHTVSYVSDVDTIMIKHVAHNRSGFAMGAVHAAEWLVQHPGFHSMQEFLNFKSV
ncbi:MAG: 4-hydroxy-tetrahydrodipicolinate reductase [Bacteroidota bacterium]|jgi:4-hydroxy-tetrahydrodipicolinate reductase